jgi:hypothetical protein
MSRLSIHVLVPHLARNANVDSHTSTSLSQGMATESNKCKSEMETSQFLRLGIQSAGQPLGSLTALCPRKGAVPTSTLFKSTWH